MTFENLCLNNSIVQALKEKGYTQPTPIQAVAIPHILNGSDLLARAQTGTGKTGAFCIPLLQRLGKNNGRAIRALILTPTRELALQVTENLTAYGKHTSLRHAAIYGGVSQVNQVKQIRNGVDILVATPGRLLDLMTQRIVNLGSLEILILDEADRMLDMGFIVDIKKILRAVPAQRQTLFFSATFDQAMQSLASSILRDPVMLDIVPETKAVMIHQSVYFVKRERKRDLLKHIIKEQQMQSVLVFTRTKHGADKLAVALNRDGISAEAFHGNKSQNARQRALSKFRKSQTRVLVATDIAARGIDIIDLPFIVNFELPDSPETYTHRIGRTGRAGATGNALSLCDHDERGQLKNINRIATSKLHVVEHPFA